MPTQRRRIGFLPRTEVQNIIDKISNHNKISQSKVTGILVEEALYSRGILNTSIKNLSFDFSYNDSSTSLSSKKTFNSEIHNEVVNNLENDFMQDEIQMINDFIEFKFFKNIMNKNKRKIK